MNENSTQLLTNEFVEVKMIESQSLLDLRWTPETINLTEEKFKSILLELAGMVEKHQITRWLGHTKEFGYITDPGVQEWTAGEFNQRLVKAGLEKMALIIATEFIANLAMQQTVEEMDKNRKEGTFKTRYFDDPEQATQWLLLE